MGDPTPIWILDIHTLSVSVFLSTPVCVVILSLFRLFFLYLTVMVFSVNDACTLQGFLVIMLDK